MFYLYKASLDSSVKRWSLPDMQLIDNISTIYSPVTSMVITCDNIFVIIGSQNNNVQIKSLITGTDIHDLTDHNSSVNCLAVSPDSERVYVGCADSKLYLYDIKSKEMIAILIEQDSSISDLKISSDSSFLFSSSGNNLYVLNLKKKNFITNKKNIMYDESKFLKCASVSKDGDLAITGDESGSVSLWNLHDGEILETIIESKLNTDKIAVCKVALSNSYLFSVIAFTNNTVCVYDNEFGEVVAEFAEHQSPVKHLFIIDNNRKILSSDGYNLCKIWLAHSGQLLESITVACNLLTLSPDNKYVISGAGENT
jgi:WD40 repeat protein